MQHDIPKKKSEARHVPIYIYLHAMQRRASHPTSTSAVELDRSAALATLHRIASS